ncbi:MAG: hypothetical protein QOH46_2045, partial [Solirubrobacteraceae bacterium]|nr:hypothetical protein [Solirubrobacteraceae bacterium]
MRTRELVDQRALGLVVRAGDEGLDRQIRWVHATELLNPAKYLKGGELIHTVALWRREPEDSERFVGALARSGASGICLGVGADDGMPDSAPSDLMEACDRHGIPLLEVPDRTPFVRVSEAVITTITRERGAGAARSLEREHDLVRAAVGEGGMPAVLSVLADDLGCDCWVLARSGRELAATAGPLPAAGMLELLAAARDARRYPAPARLPGGEPLCALPIAGGRGGRPAGWLLVARTTADLPRVARAAIDQVLEFLAIECGRLRGLQTHERRFAAGLLELIVDGKLAEPDAAAALEDFRVRSDRPVLSIAASAADDTAASDIL